MASYLLSFFIAVFFGRHGSLDQWSSTWGTRTPGEYSKTYYGVCEMGGEMYYFFINIYVIYFGCRL
jgi:hypothetical protein